MGETTVNSDNALARKSRHDATAAVREAFATFDGARNVAASGPPRARVIDVPSRTQTSQPEAMEGLGLRPWA
jgi:hypothetical protein